MNEIKNALKLNGFSEKEIVNFLSFYNKAIEQNIPYPFFYAMTKLRV